jgi:multidrug efflux pump subunit AcrA (membrane-fusion protein)
MTNICLMPSLLGLLILFGACKGSSVFRTEAVAFGALNSTVRVTGKLQSASSVFIGCPNVNRMWEYTITSMASEGKRVSAGEPIIGFDPRELMQRQQLLAADLNTRRKELEQKSMKEQEDKESYMLALAENRVNTQKNQQKVDVPADLVKAAELRKQQLDYSLAQLNEALAAERIDNHSSGMKIRLQAQEVLVKKLENDLALLGKDIASMTVPSPCEGVVVYSLDWNGRKKAVGDRCWFGDNILEIPDLTRMQVKAAVPESQARRIKIGMAVEIRLDSNPDRLFTGRVDELSQVFRSKSYDQPAIVFDAVISIDKSDPDLMRPGMAAVVDMIVSARQDVLTVPETALVYKESGVYVRKKRLLGSRLVPVSIGERSGGKVEILSGLKQGDEIDVPLLPGENGR